jgi:hypothetical protein
MGPLKRQPRVPGPKELSSEMLSPNVLDEVEKRFQ